MKIIDFVLTIDTISTMGCCIRLKHRAPMQMFVPFLFLAVWSCNPLESETAYAPDSGEIDSEGQERVSGPGRPCDGEEESCETQGTCGNICEENGLECGAVQGVTCGECKENEHCVEGECLCEGGCDGSSCHDGCGNDCPCPEGTECTDTGVCVDQSCTAACDGTHCGDDGCGGSCECEPGTICNGQRECEDEEPCTETCADFTGECGTICGEVCASCRPDQNCVDGTCLESRNCNNCPLILSLEQKTTNGKRLTGATLTLGYQPAPREPRPRLFELYLGVNSDVFLTSVTPGTALSTAGKTLVEHEETGQPWIREGDQYRIVALSMGNTETLESGRLMTLSFEMNTEKVVRFRIARREQIFAPADADAALQLSDYDGEVVVSP